MLQISLLQITLFCLFFCVYISVNFSEKLHLMKGIELEKKAIHFHFFFFFFGERASA